MFQIFVLAGVLVLDVITVGLVLGHASIVTWLAGQVGAATSGPVLQLASGVGLGVEALVLWAIADITLGAILRLRWPGAPSCPTAALARAIQRRLERRRPPPPPRGGASAETRSERTA